MCDILTLPIYTHNVKRYLRMIFLRLYFSAVNNGLFKAGLLILVSFVYANIPV